MRLGGLSVARFSVDCPAVVRPPADRRRRGDSPWFERFEFEGPCEERFERERLRPDGRPEFEELFISVSNGRRRIEAHQGRRRVWNRVWVVPCGEGSRPTQQLEDMRRPALGALKAATTS